MTVEVFINVAPGETRLALVEDGRLAEVVTRRAADQSLVGALFLGRVTRLAKELGGAYVDIGLARPGLLAATDMPKGARPFAEGDAIPVRVVRDAIDDKGPKLSGRVSIEPGAVRAPALLVPAPDPVAAFLRARAKPDWRIVADDRRLMVEGVPIGLHGERAPIFATHDIEAQLEQALQPLVVFGDGASLVIEETAALTAIDVNSGPRGGALAVNLAAAREIARQLRLRNIGGQMVVDFLPMRSREQGTRVIAALRAAVGADPCEVHVLGLTRLGLAEMTRRRVGESLAARFGVTRAFRRSADTAALDLLRAIDEQARYSGARSVAIAVSPAVKAALDGRLRTTLDELIRRHALTVGVTIDVSLAPEEYRL